MTGRLSDRMPAVLDLSKVARSSQTKVSGAK
jgi:hypothetical protein